MPDRFLFCRGVHCTSVEINIHHVLLSHVKSNLRCVGVAAPYKYHGRTPNPRADRVVRPYIHTTMTDATSNPRTNTVRPYISITVYFLFQNNSESGVIIVFLCIRKRYAVIIFAVLINIFSQFKFAVNNKFVALIPQTSRSFIKQISR